VNEERVRREKEGIKNRGRLKIKKNITVYNKIAEFNIK